MKRIARTFKTADLLWNLRAGAASPWGPHTPRFDTRMGRFRAAYLQPGQENA